MLRFFLFVLQRLALILILCNGAQAFAQQMSMQEAHAQISGMNDEALKFVEQGNYRAAIKRARRALSLSEQHLGLEHAATGSCMSNLARIYDLMGDYAAALPLHQRSLAMAEKHLGAEHSQTSIYLSNLALLHLSMGAADKALPLAERALKIAQKTQGVEHAYTGIREHNLAGIHQALGDFGKAAWLFQRAIGNAEKNLGPEHIETANRLSNLAALYRQMGAYDKALPLFQRALPIAERALGPRHPELVSMLSKFAAFYNSAGDFEKALALTQRVLAIAEHALGPEHPATGAAMNNLAQVYLALGVYDKALPLLQTALAISEKKQGLEHPETAIRLSNLAGFYRAVSAFDQALPFSQRALQISEKVHGSDHPTTGLMASNLGALYRNKGEFEKALPLYMRALGIATAIRVQSPDYANRLNNLASLYVDMGSYDSALPLYQRALGIFEKTVGAEHPDTITCLNNLAVLHEKMTTPDKAIALLHQAFAASLFKVDSSEAPILAEVADNLCFMKQKANIAESIFYCKIAVHARQNLRMGTKKLAQELQQSFAKSGENSYLLLNFLLTRAKRDTEATQVLLALKEAEFGDFANQQIAVKTQIDLTKTEAELNAALRETAAKLHARQLEHMALQNAKASQAELDKVEQAILIAKKHLQQVFSEIPSSLQKIEKEAVAQFNIENDLFVRHLANLNAATQPETNAVVAINALSNRTQITVYFDKEPVQLELPIGMEMLQPKIEAMRTGILARTDAWRAPARELFQLLIAPLETQFKEKMRAPHNLTFYISGPLRNLALAALLDNEGEFLTSKYRLSLYNPRFGSDAMPGGKKNWDITAFGSTKGKPSENLVALPQVENELFHIVRNERSLQGVLPGQMYLDAQFTRQNWGRSIAHTNVVNKRRVLHVASHFQIGSNIYQSKLLMGDGNFYSAEEIAAEPGLPLAQVDLVTLSACDTMQSNSSKGSSFEGLGALFQYKGASAVLGTLWAVADGSTAELMQKFYVNRGEQRKMSKAQALQEAQKAMLASERWRHPYYWAGFVLMGNWL